MNLCSDNHEEICYESRNCPLCNLIEEKDQEIKDLEKENYSLKNQLEDVEKELQNELDRE